MAKEDGTMGRHGCDKNVVTNEMCEAWSEDKARQAESKARTDL